MVSPSKSLIKNICYPVKIQTEATEWGCEHEKHAVEKYASFMRENHMNFVVRDSRFYIFIKKPVLGASPGSIVSCECCGEGCLEVKCPCSYKDKFITESLTDKNTCFNKTKNAEI